MSTRTLIAIVGAFILLGWPVAVYAQGDTAASAAAAITPLLLGSAASMPTGYLVGFYKLAFPQAATRWLVLIALLSGLGSSALMTMLAGGIQLTQPGIAAIVVQGLGAAALSAGVGATNASGDKKREAAGSNETVP